MPHPTGHFDLSDASYGQDANNSLLVIATFAIGQAIQINNGVIHPAGLGWLGIGMLLMLIALLPGIAGRLRSLRRVSCEQLMMICIAIQIAELIVWDIRWSSQSAITVTALLVAAATSCVALRSNARALAALTIILAAFTIAGVMSIRSMPTPIIDVWFFQQDSTAALMGGHDPYGVVFRDLYGKDLGFYGPGVSVNGWLTYSFPYPPLMLLLDVPGRLLGDVRFAHLAALNGAALLFVLASNHRRRAVLAATMFLFTPRSLLVIKAAWTEPMVLLMLASVLFTARRAPKFLWLALGGLFAIKQYTILAAPLLPLLGGQTFLPRKRREHRLSVSSSVSSVPLWPTFLSALAVSVVITLPFVLWNPTSFIRSVVLWQFRQPFRTDSLSFPAMIARTVGGELGIWFSLSAAIGAIVLVRKTCPRNAAGFACGLAFVLLAFFATSKQAFCNYYFLVVGTACSAIALSTRPRAAAAVAVEPPSVATIEPRRIAA